MATTFRKDKLKPVFPQGANLEFAALYGPEGLNQTFKSNEVLTSTGGYLVLAAAASAVAWSGVALEDGHNAAAGANNVEYCPAIPGFMFYATALVVTTAADYTVVATDRMLAAGQEVEQSATLLGTGKPGWYVGVGAVAGTAAAKIVSWIGDQPQNTSYNQEARVGDINPRVLCSLLAAQTAFTV